MRFYFLSSILSLALCSSVHSQSSDYNFFFSDGFGVIGGNAQIDVMLSIASGVEEISGWSLGVCHSSSAIDIVDVLEGSTTAGIGPDFSDQALIPGQGWTVGVLLSFVGSTTLGEGSGYSLHSAIYEVLEADDPVLNYCSSLGSPPVDTLVAFPDSSTEIPFQEAGSITISDTPPFTLAVSSSTVAPGGSSELDLILGNPLPIQAISFGLNLGSDHLQPLNIIPGSAIDLATGTAGPDFLAVDIDAGSSTGATFMCVLSLSAPYAEIPTGNGMQLAVVQYDCSADAQQGDTFTSNLVDDLGSPPVLLSATVSGVDTALVTESGMITVDGSAQGPSFIRGDVDADLDLGLGDPIQLINYLFTSGQEPTCLATADFDANGDLQLNDIINLLGFLFNDGSAPASPFPGCGPDDSINSLDCPAYPCP